MTITWSTTDMKVNDISRLGFTFNAREEEWPITMRVVFKGASKKHMLNITCSYWNSAEFIEGLRKELLEIGLFEVEHYKEFIMNSHRLVAVFICGQGCSTCILHTDAVTGTALLTITMFEHLPDITSTVKVFGKALKATHLSAEIEPAPPSRIAPTLHAEQRSA